MTNNQRAGVLPCERIRVNQHAGVLPCERIRITHNIGNLNIISPLLVLDIELFRSSFVSFPGDWQ